MAGESQDDPHAWASTALAHCWLGLGIWGGIAVITDRWLAVYCAPIVYFLLVEGVQIALAQRVNWRLIFDAILDTVAVTFGCIAGACTGDGNLNGAMAAWGASIGVVAAGWLVRDA